MASEEKYMELFTEAGNLAGDLIRLDGQPAPKLGFFQKRKLKKAARLYEQATHEAPENGAPHLMLGKVQERLGEHEKYLASLQKAWLLETGNLILIIELSGAYGFLNKHQEAISVLLEGRKHYPDEPRILFNLGISFLLTNQANGAIEVFEKMVVIEPDYEMNQKMLEYAKKVASGEAPSPKGQSDIAKGI
ncbi:tetratricopeptide repeat protein [bacterium AH-315-K03]|nr:tetratricopeptide repeat protein [bacterium AH-315-K03]